MIFTRVLFYIFILSEFVLAKSVSTLGYTFDPDLIENPIIRQTSDLNEKMAYSFVYDTCSNPRNISDVANFAFQGAKASATMIFELDSDKMKSLYQRRGLSPMATVILNSMGLHLALSDCFGSNDFAKQSYVIQLIAADIQGTVGGIAINFVGGFFIYKGVTWIVAKTLWGPLTSFLLRSSVPKKIIKVIGASMSAGAAGMGIHLARTSIIEDQKQAQHIDQEASDGGPEADIVLTEKSLLAALKSFEQLKNTNFESYWQDVSYKRFQELYREIFLANQKGKLSSKSLQMWTAKYASYVEIYKKLIPV